MAKSSDKKIAQALLNDMGQTFSEEVGFKLKNTPSPLFQMLYCSVLFSTRISNDLALQAAQALKKKRWTTPQKMVESTWKQRTNTLNKAGYARYDESTSDMLGFDAQFLLDEYKGDLRNLRQKAEKDPEKERKLIKDFKGIGEVGADIFFREVQTLWDEQYPLTDKKAIKGAAKLGLPQDSDKLAGLVSKKDYPRLLSALIRVQFENKYDEIKEAAAKL